jgi:hypothetical protein
MGPTRVTAAVPTPSHPLHINLPVTSLEFVSAAMHPGGRNNLIKSTIEAGPKKHRPPLRANILAEEAHFLCRLNLRLRGLCYFGPQEHGPETREPGTQ